MNLTEAQKGDWRNFKEGQVIQFNQNIKHINRGSIWTITQSSEKGIFIQNEALETFQLPIHRSKDYDLYEKNTIPLSKNDVIRITRNSFDEQKGRLNNGQMMEVIQISKDGRIKLRNTVSKAEYEVNKDFGHLTHAYCITSHASQGKTVDEVLIAQPAATFPATDSKQVYVSVSRGREKVTIYTDDKTQLLEYASKAGDRQSALELVRKKNLDAAIVQQHIREKLNKDSPLPVNRLKGKEPSKQKLTKDKDYEPRI